MTAADVQRAAAVPASAPGEARMPFGRHWGRRVSEVVVEDMSYVYWALSRPFVRELYPDTHAALLRALARHLRAEIEREDLAQHRYADLI